MGVGPKIHHLEKAYNMRMYKVNTDADSKSRALEPSNSSNDVSFVIFGHQIWDLEGGVKLTPPPSVFWFSSTPAGIGLK